MTPTPPPSSSGAAAPDRVDGRQARRERGRLAVINAMIDLVFETHEVPTVEQITERSGVSVASVFRYFDTLDDLRKHATQHYFDKYSDAFEIPSIGDGSLDERISRLVTARVNQHQTTAPMARLARHRAFAIPEVDDVLHRLRAMQSDQLQLQFDTELAAASTAERHDTIALLATITSFESWDQFQRDYGRSAAQIRRAWNRAVTAVLSNR